MLDLPGAKDAARNWAYLAVCSCTAAGAGAVRATSKRYWRALIFSGAENAGFSGMFWGLMLDGTEGMGFARCRAGGVAGIGERGDG